MGYAEIVEIAEILSNVFYTISKALKSTLVFPSYTKYFVKNRGVSKQEQALWEVDFERPDFRGWGVETR